MPKRDFTYDSPGIQLMLVVFRTLMAAAVVYLVVRSDFDTTASVLVIFFALVLLALSWRSFWIRMKTPDDEA